MPQSVRYLTHPQVLIEPMKDVRKWSLSEVGRNRVSALAAEFGLLSGTRRIVSSDETKALETATPLARALGLALEVRPQMHENDRSATGYLPPQEFEAVADRFFAEPAVSVRGWETAEDAQRRIVAEVKACLSGPQGGMFCSSGMSGSAPCCSAPCRASGSIDATAKVPEVAGAGSSSTWNCGGPCGDGSRWKPS